MLNWLGRLLQLPEALLNVPGQNGGGCIQVSSYQELEFCFTDLKNMAMESGYKTSIM